jgi:hypothetical protein
MLFAGQFRLSLKKLVLNNCLELGDDVVQIISLCIPGLEHLSMCSCTRISDTGISYIGSNCTKLSSLRLANTRITGLSLRHLSIMLNDLSLLDIRSCVYVSASSIAPVQARYPNLRLLR